MKQTGNTQTREEITPELLEQAKAKDREALGELYKRTQLDIYRTIHAMVRDEDMTLDIQQDTYLKAFSRLDQLRDAASFLPWLRQIAVNEARAQFRKKQPLLFTEMGNDEEESSFPDLPDLRPEASPELSLDRKETNRLIQEILGGLSDGQRMLLGMYYYEQISIKQIAEDTGLSVNTIKVQLHRGRKRVETEVKKLEAQGIKLYGLSPMPFLLALMKQQRPVAEAGEAVLTKTLARAGVTAGGKALAAAGAKASAAPVAQAVAVHVGRRFFETALGKLVLAVIVTGAIGGGVAGYQWFEAHRNHDTPEPTDVELQVVPTAPTEPTINLTETNPDVSDTDARLFTEVTVTEPAKPPKPSATEPTPTEPKPTQPKPTEPTPTEPTPTEPTGEDARQLTGACGEHLSFTYAYKTGALSIEGSGTMYDYYAELAPWSDVAAEIKTVSLPEGLSGIGYGAFSGCSALTAVRIPDSVVTIGDWAFGNCSALESVNVPAAVSTIERDSFAACTAMTAINVAAANANYSSLDGVLFNKEKTALIRYPCGKPGFYEIPDGVTTITDNAAFCWSVGLTGVKLPESLRQISGYAFADCPNLTDVILPEGLESIDCYAFNCCTKLRNVNFPESLKWIGMGCFVGCESLTEIVLPDGMVSIGDFGFGGCSNLTKIHLPKSLEVISYGAFNNCVSLRSISLPEGAESIGIAAFKDCKALTGIYVPASVETIASDAFGSGKSKLNKTLVIYGPEGSAAQSFAEANDFQFVVGALPD